MAHNLNYNENLQRHAFFSVKEKAWHNLGVVIDSYPTSAEAIQFAGLNFEVQKQPLFTVRYNADGQAMDHEKNVSTHFATMRMDTHEILGIVGNKYQVVQNAEAFTFFDAIVGGGDGIFYETAGALGNGEKIFITAKLPDYIKVGSKDVIEKYIFLTTSHDGSGAITAAFTPIRIVCNNTLNAALKNMSNCVTIRHTLNASQQLTQAHKVMQIATYQADKLTQVFNKWANTRVTDAEVKKLIGLAMSPTPEAFTAIASNNTAFEFSRQFEEVTGQIFEYAATAESQQLNTTKGTLFGVYNAITGYYQNVADYKSQDAKLKSIMFGTALSRTQKAFELCQNAKDFLN